MLIKSTVTSTAIKESEVTPQQVYLNRRTFMAGLAAAVASPILPAATTEYEGVKPHPAPDWLHTQVKRADQWQGSTDETLTPYQYASTYNNFYEFGTAKNDPHQQAKDFITDPWSVEIEGEVARPGKFTLEDILKPHDLEERIYRLRCVEAWSMVIPWIGFPLADLLKRFEPTSDARYVEFTTLYDPDQMPSQNSFFSSIQYPYVEGLRLDEAMNPLALMVVGMYGDTLPPQNGAPLRLVVPWKYGFKSIKSIVSIRLVKKMPMTTWVRTAASEYGFYANVNPAVDHPRWSQKQERRLPSSWLQANRIPTLPFNGYGDQVASLYTNMDLTKFF